MDLNRIGWISGAPSKRRMKGRLSTTSTALPTSSAASDAVKKLVNGMPYSCSVIHRVNRIRLKPKKKKIVGGSTCFTWMSHQAKARRQSGACASEAAGTDGVMASSGDRRHACSSYYLLLKATRGVTISLISSRERKRRQPGLATNDPAFVRWHQLIRSIQGSQVHFDFVCGARENGRAAAGTEKPPGVVACFASDRHRILREHRGSMKKGPVMLAAVETVTKAEPVRGSRRHKADVATKATARESIHAASPLK